MFFVRAQIDRFDTLDAKCSDSTTLSKELQEKFNVSTSRAGMHS